MIYSADVRPDVHLITQNALADGTYMSVMRDLYGNEIWIPSVVDSASAFGEFVREIEQGIRAPVPGVSVQNGRVQVSGVLGVMEINAILARNIFERNRARHEFFVEESYVIRWMYPYLAPHGLILKINHDALAQLPQSVIDDDLDFWDWYTRRFLAHPMFRRDVVAQKSFSKLRSAIAGLYAHRGLLREAEIAFMESLDLYPLSPESHFRLAELYLRTARFDAASRLMQSFIDLDPANDRGADFLGQIRNIEQTHIRQQELEQQMRSGTISAQDALTLADLYRQRGQVEAFRAVADSLVGAPQMPAFFLFPVANMYGQMGQHERGREVARLALERMPSDAPPHAYLEVMQVLRTLRDDELLLTTLQRYLALQPADWRQWLELARMQAARNEIDAAGAALGAAMRFGGTEARLAIDTNPALAQILQQQADRRRGVLGIGR
jgi:tetratricopeptide (TPR) repeat protein